MRASSWRESRAGGRRESRADAATMLRLAIPLLINNLASAGMTTTDTVMAGHLGAVPLAAVAVGANYIGIFYLTGLGLLMALSPTIAHAFGAQRTAAVGSYFRQSLWLAALCGFIGVVGLLFAEPFLLSIGTPAEVAALSARYLHAMAWGLPAMFGFLALRFSSEGIGWTRPVMYMAVGAFAVNLALNSVFMYGRFGAPALGAVGCGVATSCAEWLLFLAMFLYVRQHRRYREFAPLARFEAPQALHLSEILKLGLPIAGSLLAEGGLFSAAGLIMGTLGATVVAAHAIGISCASLIFMLPLSVHSATTIHVGHRAGAGRWRDAQRAGWVGIALCVSFMCCSCVALLLLREPIARLYTSDPAVLAIAIQLLLFAGIFQVADGLQVGAAGALRGFKDARVPMLLNVISYWGIGFPLAWYFGLRAGQGAAAVWLGLIAGLLVCAILLTLRYRAISQRAVLEGKIS